LLESFEDVQATSQLQLFRPLRLPSEHYLHLEHRSVAVTDSDFYFFRKLSEKDPRAEPLPSQRVPYIVVYGSPGLPLIQLVRRPQEFIGNPNLRLNAHYYIEKAIMPALNRCLALANLDVGRW
jgi:DNA polymerase zeta